MHAAKGGGIYRSVEEAAAKMSHVVKKFKPNPTNVELYDKIYEKVLMELYPATKKIQSELREISGTRSAAQ